MNKLRNCLKLFLVMIKIGLFTFGGGYAMIALLQREFVERKNWISQDEFTDMIAISESTPGPIAINSATFIGYKLCGVLGSVFATIGVVLPSFIIIFSISLFFDKFIELTLVQYAFKGVQACVVYLILSAGFKMFKSLKKNVLTITLFCLTIISLVCITIFSLNFSSIYLILIGAVVGLIVYSIGYFRSKKINKKNKEDSSFNDTEKGGKA